MAIVVTPSDVCAVEQTALESAILHQRAMKEPTPRGIGEITIHGDAGVRRERSADVVPCTSRWLAKRSGKESPIRSGKAVVPQKGLTCMAI